MLQPNQTNFLQYKYFSINISSFGATFLSKTLPKIYKTFFIRLLFEKIIFLPKKIKEKSLQNGRHLLTGLIH